MNHSTPAPGRSSAGPAIMSVDTWRELDRFDPTLATKALQRARAAADAAVNLENAIAAGVADPASPEWAARTICQLQNVMPKGGDRVALLTDWFKQHLGPVKDAAVLEAMSAVLCAVGDIGVSVRRELAQLLLARGADPRVDAPDEDDSMISPLASWLTTGNTAMLDLYFGAQLFDAAHPLPLASYKEDDLLDFLASHKQALALSAGEAWLLGRLAPGYDEPQYKLFEDDLAWCLESRDRSPIENRHRQLAHDLALGARPRPECAHADWQRVLAFDSDGSSLAERMVQAVYPEDPSPLLDRLIKDAGMDVDHHSGPRCGTLLHRAINNNDERAVAALLARGASTSAEIEISHANGTSELMSACQIAQRPSTDVAIAQMVAAHAARQAIDGALRSAGQAHATGPARRPGAVLAGGQP